MCSTRKFTSKANCIRACNQRSHCPVHFTTLTTLRTSVLESLQMHFEVAVQGNSQAGDSHTRMWGTRKFTSRWLPHMDVGYKEIHKQVTPTHGCAVQGNSQAGDSHTRMWGTRKFTSRWLPHRDVHAVQGNSQAGDSHTGMCSTGTRKFTSRWFPQGCFEGCYSVLWL